jgi:hypothetical protein
MAMEHVGDSTPAGVRREAAHEPGRDRGGSPRGPDHEKKTRQRPPVRPADERIPPSVALLQDQPKDRRHESRRCATEERQDREREQPPAFGGVG